MRALILLAGPELPHPALLRAAKSADLLIAADAGAAHALWLGRRPEVWLGDFDSADPELKGLLEGVEIKAFPREKDATDAELAVAFARERGAKELLLVGALGGELDHSLLNLTLGVRLFEEGINALLSGGGEWAFPLLPPGRALPLSEGDAFSVVPLSPLSGLVIRGAKYELAGAEVGFGRGWTLRNRARGRVEIGLSSGRAVVIARPKRGFCPWRKGP